MDEVNVDGRERRVLTDKSGSGSADDEGSGSSSSGGGGLIDVNNIAKYAFAERVFKLDDCTSADQIDSGDVCYTMHRGNGICTSACNTEACAYDSGDCKCSYTSDCPSGQICNSDQSHAEFVADGNINVGKCKVDADWESCAETMCRTDDDCDRASSSCGAGFVCGGSSCVRDCNEWCKDTFGTEWESDQGAKADTADGCYSCNLAPSTAHHKWIVVGCVLGSVLIVLIPGIITIVCCKGAPVSGMVSPGLPVDFEAKEFTEENAEGRDTTVKERRDTNPNIAETNIDRFPQAAPAQQQQNRPHFVPSQSVGRPGAAPPQRVTGMPVQRPPMGSRPPQQVQRLAMGARPPQQQAQRPKMVPAPPRPGAFAMPPQQQQQDAVSNASSSSSV